MPYDVSGTPTPANLLNGATWQFYSGSSDSIAAWNTGVSHAMPVISDTRLLYRTIVPALQSDSECPEGQAVIAQGGAVYDAPLQPYIISSWSCTTNEFYEAPDPWGPWSHITSGGVNGNMAAPSNDFGPLLGQPTSSVALNRGQYRTSIPSTFISADGQTLYLQSIICEPCLGKTSDHDGYTFSLRQLRLQRPIAGATATNGMSSTNLATMPGTFAVSKSTHYGQLCGLNCTDILVGTALGSEDDFDTENKVEDNMQSYWGYTWPQPYNLNQVVYTIGNSFPDGGWFGSSLTVQIYQNFQWVNATNVTPTPAYPYNSTAIPHQVYTFNFDPVVASGTSHHRQCPTFYIELQFELLHRYLESWRLLYRRIDQPDRRFGF